MLGAVHDVTQKWTIFRSGRGFLVTLRHTVSHFAESGREGSISDITFERSLSYDHLVNTDALSKQLL